GWGNYIVIDHGGGKTTLYAHNTQNLVKVNDNVKRGDVIGKVGSTGWSTGNHLHFGYYEDGVPKNPLLNGLSVP
ncbi:MAG: M23 family metallopeptidase, partial [Oscillospiraceae bacterium]|nr:M23 family metallopeptidase [Oscillospiraceae bacterium]